MAILSGSFLSKIMEGSQIDQQTHWELLESRKTNSYLHCLLYTLRAVEMGLGADGNIASPTAPMVVWSDWAEEQMLDLNHYSQNYGISLVFLDPFGFITWDFSHNVLLLQEKELHRYTRIGYMYWCPRWPSGLASTFLVGLLLHKAGLSGLLWSFKYFNNGS